MRFNWLSAASAVWSQATDEQCLLARPTRADTLEEETEEEEDLHYQGGASSDYMKRWEGKWEKQEPLHRLSHFVALAVRAARDPSRVKLIPTLLSHFWSWRSGDPKEGLVATTLQWTQRNVPSGGVAIDISSRMTAVKTWLEKYLDYEAPFYKIKEARAEAETALRDIKERPKISERALSIANYLLAATSLMVMWREEYDLLETKSVRVNMEGAYEEIRETLKDLVDVFWIYRWGFIRMREDPSDNTYDGFMWFDDFLKVKRKCSVDRKYFSKFQDVVTQVLKREIFVLELAPMLKSFTTLHRLIPGREEEPPQSEPFFPEKIYLGPYCDHDGHRGLDVAPRGCGPVPLPQRDRNLWRLHLEGRGPHGRCGGPFVASPRGLFRNQDWERARRRPCGD